MIGLLAVLLLLLPLVELIVIIKVGAAIGALEAVALLVVVSLVGVWLVKREGLAVLRRAQREVDAGRMPTASLLDGVLLLVAGGLLIFPGFVTDVLGVLLLLPPVRILLRRVLVARYGRRISATIVTGGTVTGGTVPGGVRASGRIVDVDSRLEPDGWGDGTGGAAGSGGGSGTGGRIEPPSLPGPS